jgi:ABC-2 type transport system permease protein
MWKIARKDIHIFFSDKKALFLSLLLPIGLITLFAFAFGGTGEDTSEPSPVILQFTDLDSSASSIALIASLDSIPGIQLEKVSDEAGNERIMKGDRIAQVLLYQGFEDALLSGQELPAELRFDQSREMEVGVLQNLLTSRLSQMQGVQNAQLGIDRIILNTFPDMPTEMADTIKKQMLESNNEPNRVIDMHSIVGKEESNWGLIQAVAGTAIMMLLFSVSTIGASIIDEKEQGVLKRLLQSPMPPFSILFGKLISACIISIFQLTVMFLFAWLAFGLDLSMNIPGVILMILVTSVCCASFGIFLASVATSKRQVDSLGTIIILFMSAIGGSMIPLYIMPDFMQDIAIVSVNYWSIQGFYDIFWRELGVSELTDNLLVLGAITAAMLGLSFYFFRRNTMRLH